MKGITFSIALSLIMADANEALGQKGYQPGYVVTLKGDTVQGSLNYSVTARPIYSRKVKLKPDRGSAHSYRANQLIGFRRGDEEYESLPFRQSWSMLTESFSSRAGADKEAFLRRTVHGHLSLYYYEFIDQEAGTVESVPLFKRANEHYFVRVTQGILGLKKKRLSEYFSDYPELIEQINSGKVKSPQEIATRYNQWNIGLTE